jgi:predicted PurR-regulated permease PerM
VNNTNAPITPARVMLNTAAILFVVGLAWLLVKIHFVIILLIIGILFATAIEPLANRLRRRGLSRGQAILAVYLAIFCVVGVLIFLAVPPVIRQVTELVNHIPSILADLEAQALTSRNSFINTTGADAIRKASEAYAKIRSNGPGIKGEQAVRIVSSVIGLLITVVSTLVIAFYWMTEKVIIKRLVLSLVPLDKRDHAHRVWDDIEAKLGGWTRGQLMLCAIMGVATGIVYFALGLHFWLPLAVLAGVTEIIPYIGPVIGGAAAIVVAFAQSPREALFVAIAAVVLQQIEGHVLVPRVMNNAVGLTPLTVVLAVIIGETILGPLGAVLAVPIGAAVQVLVQDLLRAREAAPDTGETGAMVAAALTGRPAPPPIEAEAIDTLDNSAAEHRNANGIADPDGRAIAEG